MKTQQLENLLPQDGEVYFYGYILSQEEADYYFLRLLTAIVDGGIKQRISGAA